MSADPEEHHRELHREKLASLGRLAASVTHEINNPLSFVSSNLDVLSQYVTKFLNLLNAYRDFRKEMSDYAPAEVIVPVKKVERDVDAEFLLQDIGQLVKETREGTQRIREIVKSLKRFARIDRGDWEEVDLNGEIEATLRIAASELKKKGKVVTQLREIPLIRCYPGQLSQVILNLLVNAAQAIEGRGEIRVETECADGKIRLSIADDGSGIPDDVKKRLFEPFFTTKDADKGTGLGLAISKDIIERHAGTIEVQSQVGKGTTFTIWLPVNTLAATAHKEVKP